MLTMKHLFPVILLFVISKSQLIWPATSTTSTPWSTCADECNPGDNTACDTVNFEVCGIDERQTPSMHGPTCHVCADECLMYTWKCYTEADCDIAKESLQSQYFLGTIEMECAFPNPGERCGNCQEVWTTTGTTTDTPVYHPCAGDTCAYSSDCAFNSYCDTTTIIHPSSVCPYGCVPSSTHPYTTTVPPECTETGKCNPALVSYGADQCATALECIPTTYFPGMGYHDICAGECIDPSAPLPTCADECNPEDHAPCDTVNFEVCSIDERQGISMYGPTCNVCVDECLRSPWHCLTVTDCDTVAANYPDPVEMECAFHTTGERCGYCQQIYTTTTTDTPLSTTLPPQCTETGKCNPALVWYDADQCAAPLECRLTTYFPGMQGVCDGECLDPAVPAPTCVDECDPMDNTPCDTANFETCSYDERQGLTTNGPCYMCVDQCLMSPWSCLTVADCDMVLAPGSGAMECYKPHDTDRCGMCQHVYAHTSTTTSSPDPPCAPDTCAASFDCPFASFCDTSVASTDPDVLCPYECATCTDECDANDPFACSAADEMCTGGKGGSGCRSCKKECVSYLYGCITDADCSFETAFLGVSAMTCDKFDATDPLSCGECIESCPVGTCDPYMDHTGQCETGFLCQEDVNTDPSYWNNCGGTCVADPSSTSVGTTQTGTTETSTTETSDTETITTETSNTETGTTQDTVCEEGEDLPFCFGRNECRRSKHAVALLNYAYCKVCARMDTYSCQCEEVKALVDQQPLSVLNLTPKMEAKIVDNCFSSCPGVGDVTIRNAAVCDCSALICDEEIGQNPITDGDIGQNPTPTDGDNEATIDPFLGSNEAYLFDNGMRVLLVALHLLFVYIL